MNRIRKLKIKEISIESNSSMSFNFNIFSFAQYFRRIDGFDFLLIFKRSRWFWNFMLRCQLKTVCFVLLEILSKPQLIKRLLTAKAFFAMIRSSFFIVEYISFQRVLGKLTQAVSGCLFIFLPGNLKVWASDCQIVVVFPHLPLSKSTTLSKCHFLSLLYLLSNNFWSRYK